MTMMGRFRRDGRNSVEKLQGSAVGIRGGFIAPLKAIGDYCSFRTSLHQCLGSIVHLEPTKQRPVGWNNTTSVRVCSGAERWTT